MKLIAGSILLGLGLLGNLFIEWGHLIRRPIWGHISGEHYLYMTWVVIGSGVILLISGLWEVIRKPVLFNSLQPVRSESNDQIKVKRHGWRELWYDPIARIILLFLGFVLVLVAVAIFYTFLSW
jgi:hypothetical protein